MKPYDSYLFDADGTLFDTVDLICKCFQYVAEKYAGMTMDRSTIINGIGLPLKNQLIAHLGPEFDHDRILDDYLQYQLIPGFPGSGDSISNCRYSFSLVPVSLAVKID